MSGAIGVLGGAFNPPHIGHLLLAQEAMDALALDELILMPTGNAPHRVISPEPGAGVRLEMARLAAEGVEGVSVSASEVERDGPSYTCRTLEVLANDYPGSQLTFVMGADVAAGLEGWHRPERVLELCRLGIAGRPGFDRSEVDGALGRLGAGDRADAIEMPPVDVSSSLVRARIAACRPIRWLVPDPVRRLIAENGLYEAARPAGTGGGA